MSLRFTLPTSFRQGGGGGERVEGVEEVVEEEVEAVAVALLVLSTRGKTVWAASRPPLAWLATALIA